MTYDIYGERCTQLKVGECENKHYRIGDEVALQDGVYLGYEGVVVVVGGRFVAEFPRLIDKWGEEFPFDDVLLSRSPVTKVIQGLSRGVSR